MIQGMSELPTLILITIETRRTFHSTSACTLIDIQYTQCIREAIIAVSWIREEVAS